MEENEITNNGGESVDRNPDGTFKDGHKKLGGKEKGTRDFSTDFDEAVEEIAKENKMTKSEVRKLLLKVAYKNAKEGNYSFYKDIHDRLYGTAMNNSNMNIKGTLNISIPPAVAETFNINDTNKETGTSN